MTKPTAGLLVMLVLSLLITNKKSYKHFRLVLKSMTFDDLDRSLLTLFQNVCIFPCPPRKFECR